MQAMYMHQQHTAGFKADCYCTLLSIPRLAGLAWWQGARLVSGRKQVGLPGFGSLFSSKIVIYGHCLVTLPCTINETVKWLTLLPILMRNSFWW